MGPLHPARTPSSRRLPPTHHQIEQVGFFAARRPIETDARPRERARGRRGFRTASARSRRASARQLHPAQPGPPHPAGGRPQATIWHLPPSPPAAVGRRSPKGTDARRDTPRHPRSLFQTREAHQTNKYLYYLAPAGDPDGKASPAAPPSSPQLFLLNNPLSSPKRIVWPVRCVGRRAGPHPGEIFVGARFSPPFHTPRASCHEFPYRALVQDASVACPRPSSSRPLAVWHGAGATGAPSSSLFVDASCARWNAAGVLLIEPAQMDGWAQRPSSRCISVGVRWLASALPPAARVCLGPGRGRTIFASSVPL